MRRRAQRHSRTVETSYLGQASSFRALASCSQSYLNESSLENSSQDQQKQLKIGYRTMLQQ